MSSIKCITNHFLSTCPWKKEDSCYKAAIAPGKAIFLHFNVTVLGYYIMGHNANREGDAKQVLAALDGINCCVLELRASRQRETSKVLTQILKSKVARL